MKSDPFPPRQGERVLPQSVGGNIRGRWGRRGVGGDMQTIAVCRLTKKADLAIISVAFYNTCLSAYVYYLKYRHRL